MKILLLGNTKCHAVERLQEEFEKRGHIFETVAPFNLVFSVQAGKVLLASKEGNNLLDFDTYLFRGMGKRNNELSVIARYVKKQGKYIVEEKFAQNATYYGKFSPSMVDDGVPVIDYEIHFGDSLKRAHIEYPKIAKNLESSMGKKVRLLNNEEELADFVEKFGYPILLQKYIPIEYDFRVMVVDGEVLGVMKRYNDGDDFLTIRRGGKRESVELPQEALDVALRATESAGLSVSGVDLLEHEGKYYRIEVNMSPQFKVFERITGVNVAEKIVEMVERKNSK
jgi:ribosomal protein S6--L-glutamate ligase